jgi:beta-mannosidase
MQLHDWHIHDFAPGDGERAGAHAPDYNDADWLPATVPGDVHLDLLRAGRIPDPFYGMNFREVAWVAEREWWYRAPFEAPPPRPPAAGGATLSEAKGLGPVELVFHGLDCFATVWLNGERTGESANMWLPARFDISRYLRPGPNVLTVRLGSPRSHPTALRGLQTGFHDMVGNGERFYSRKAQMSYGWDIAPELVTVGIWRPVEVIARAAAAIRDVWVRPRGNDPSDLVCEIGIEGFEPIEAVLHRGIRGSTGPDRA